MTPYLIDQAATVHRSRFRHGGRAGGPGDPPVSQGDENRGAAVQSSPADGVVSLQARDERGHGCVSLSVRKRNSSHPRLATRSGGFLGLGAGVLFGSYEAITPPMDIPGQPSPPGRGFRREAALTLRRTTIKARSWGKNFAMVTAVFSGVECAIEKTRAKKDIYNGVSAGCVTGAALAARAGPEVRPLHWLRSATVDRFVLTLECSLSAGHVFRVCRLRGI